MRSWKRSSVDFYKESIPPDEYEPDFEEDEDDGGSLETNWLEMWALCVSNGISDTEWEHMTIPKIRALMKAKNKEREFEVIMHGGEIKNKKAKKAMYLSDLGYFPKQ